MRHAASFSVAQKSLKSVLLKSSIRSCNVAFHGTLEKEQLPFFPCSHICTLCGYLLAATGSLVFQLFTKWAWLPALQSPVFLSTNCCFHFFCVPANLLSPNTTSLSLQAQPACYDRGNFLLSLKLKNEAWLKTGKWSIVRKWKEQNFN